MKLSICVPTYNRPKQMNRLIKTFVEENLFHDVELCISDNGNFPLPYHYKAVRYRRNKENIEFDRNLYEAMKMGRGDWLWLMGDDDYPKDVSDLIDELDSCPSCMAGEDIIIINHKTDELAKNPAGFMTNIIIRKSAFESLDRNWLLKGFDTLYFHEWMQVMMAMDGKKHHSVAGEFYVSEPSHTRDSIRKELRFYVPWIRFRFWCFMLAINKRKNRMFFARKFITAFFIPILAIRLIREGGI